MANTANLNLFKPTRDDYINVERDISQNMDKIDAGVAEKAKASEIGIVITGNTASYDVAVGQYVIVRGSTISNIEDGLYVSKSSVPAGQAFSENDLDNSDTAKGLANAFPMHSFGVTPYYSNTSPSSISKLVEKDGYAVVNGWPNVQGSEWKLIRVKINNETKLEFRNAYPSDHIVPVKKGETIEVVQTDYTIWIALVLF